METTLKRYDRYDPWEYEIAERVRLLIVSKNGGRWPQNVSEWEHVARKLGMKLKPGRFQTSFSAYLLGNAILYRVVDDERLCRWIAHEVCEGALRRECGEEPYCFLPGPHDSYHRIARMLEPK